MIDWSKAPEWANYAAMDQDGDWFWYAAKPRPLESFWSACGGMALIINEKSWIDSLQEKPKE